MGGICTDMKPPLPKHLLMLPPEFESCPDVRPEDVRARPPGATYFVTFRLSDALPPREEETLRTLRRSWRQEGLPPAEVARRTAQAVETALDQGHGECILRDSRGVDCVQQVLLRQDSVLYRAFASVVMPNHVHLLVKPTELDLDTMLKKLKTGSAKRLCDTTATNVPVWRPESHIRVVRDLDHLIACVRYIGRNALRLKVDPESVRWMSALWVRAGWSFFDG